MVRWRRWVSAVLACVTVAGCSVTGDKAGGNDSPEPVVLLNPRVVGESADTVFGLRRRVKEIGRITTRLPGASTLQTAPPHRRLGRKCWHANQ